MTTQTTETFAEIGVPANPFPGLRPFDFDESHLFFGRDGQSERLIDKLSRTRFLAVVGTSGSGKSSLVRAGLLPALLGGFMNSAGSDWRMAILRPGNDPIGRLAEALNASTVFGSEDRENHALQIAITEATLRRGNRGLVDAVGQNAMPSNENLLVVVDQFEELFRFAREASRKTKEEGERYQNDAAAFVKLLLEAHRQSEVNIYVVLTMRSDFLGDCSQFWGLPEAVNESQYLIPRLTRQQLREAITGPIAVAGGEISPRLINRLLNDVGDDQDQLPVLQHLLMRVWHEQKERRLEVEIAEGDVIVKRPHRDLHEGRPIDLCCYEAVGGMAEALSRHADEAFNELPDETHQLVAERLFKALTEKGPDNREIRRPLTLAEILAVTQANHSEVVTVIDAFRQPGRSFLMPPAEVSLDVTSLIDISHESLIRRWQRLKKWTDDEAQSSRIYKRLAETAILYREGKEGFLKDPALQVAQIWRKENAPNPDWARRYHPAFETAITFLEDSQKDASKHRRRRLITGAIVVAILLGSSLLTLGYQRKAIKYQEEALFQSASQLQREVQLKDEAESAKASAEAAEKTARNKAQELATSLENEQKAKQTALTAQAEALRERDNARRLQGEKQDQATTSGYFKDALNDLAAGNHGAAAESLEKALAHFEIGKDTADILSTHIILGDVYRDAYRKSEEPADGVKALKSYDGAIAMLKSGVGNEKRLTLTFEKAGSVFADSSDPDEQQRAAAYYEQAAAVYKAQGLKDDESARYIDIGKIFSRSDESEAVEEAKGAFDRAINVYSDEGNRTREAETSSAIAEHYEVLLDKEKEAEEDEDSSGSDRQITLHKDRLREAAVRYYERAAAIYHELQDKEKEVTELLNAAGMWEGIDSREAQREVAGFYNRAVAVYEGNYAKQVATLIRIGRPFVRSTNTTERAKAEPYFQQAVTLAQNKGGSRAAALANLDVGVTYTSNRRFPGAIPYFERSLALYTEVNDVLGQATALYRLAIAKNSITSLRPEALPLADQSLSLFSQVLPGMASSPDRKSLAEGYYAVGVLYRLKKDNNRAVTNLRRAVEIFEEMPGYKAERILRSRVTAIKRLIALLTRTTGH